MLRTPALKNQIQSTRTCATTAVNLYELLDIQHRAHHIYETCITVLKMRKHRRLCRAMAYGCCHPHAVYERRVRDGDLERKLHRER